MRCQLLCSALELFVLSSSENANLHDVQISIRGATIESEGFTRRFPDRKLEYKTDCQVDSSNGPAAECKSILTSIITHLNMAVQKTKSDADCYLAKYDSPAPGNSRMEEQLRRFSAHATHSIAKHFGRRIGIWVGCGYPKSGTVWLCQLMGSVLDLPYTQNYLLPVAMPSVVHAHWEYSAKLPKCIYIVRDGRDVMVSYYHYRMKSLDGHRNPGIARKLMPIFTKHLGKDFKSADIQVNLPRFLELELGGKLSSVRTWPDHVRQWTTPRHENVGLVRYEDLLQDGPKALGDAFEQVLGKRFEPWILETAIRRFDFDRRSGRSRGDEDTEAFMRKGIAGDWKSSFTKEAREVFDRYAGDVLIEMNYEPNRDWIHSL